MTSCESLATALDIIGKIHPGSTRADLEKVFELDGSVHAFSSGTYLYKQCPYIKVDVQFKEQLKKRSDQNHIWEDLPWTEYRHFFCQQNQPFGRQGIRTRSRACGCRGETLGKVFLTLAPACGYYSSSPCNVGDGNNYLSQHSI